MRDNRRMQRLRNYGDSRQRAQCVHCGGDTATGDHVPSKVLLDRPYPPNLPVVPACPACNGGFSVDEPYLACLIACTLLGSVDSERLRPKVRRILAARPAIREALRSSRREDKDGISFEPNHDRVLNVILKLARGHAAFELNEPQFEEPESVSVRPLISMSDEERADFETPPKCSVWPEVGSRESQRLASRWPDGSSWLLLQPGRYRYLASVGDGMVVRIVLSEYLACEVTWP
jgi:hypothetical protein